MLKINYVPPINMGFKVYVTHPLRLLEFFLQIVWFFWFVWVVFFWGGGLFRVLVLHERCSLIWRSHHYRWLAANFDLHTVFIDIAQWEFVSVPNLLWNGTYNFNGYLWGYMTLTLVAERLAAELPITAISFMFFTAGFSACEAYTLTDCSSTKYDLQYPHR